MDLSTRSPISMVRTCFGYTTIDVKMIALAARICHTPLSISFEPSDDHTHPRSGDSTS